MKTVLPIVLATAFLAQTAPPAQGPEPQAQPVFRSRVDYVSVDVVVTGAGDKPVTDLTAADFGIRDDDRPQEIADFRFVNIPLPHRNVNADPEPATVEVPPSPDVVTNATSKDSRVFVLIVDDLHLVPLMIVPVKRVMTEFINNLAPDDEVAILFAGRSDISQNFTRDRARLLKTVSNVRAAFGFGIGTYAQEQIEDLPASRSVAWQFKNVALALAQSGHSRRAIVFVGAFSQLDPGAGTGTRELAHAQILQSDLDDAWAAARRANVPIYTLDPRGIPNDGNSTGVGSVTIYGADSGFATRPAPLAVDRRRAMIQQDHLWEIANATGGRAFINRSDVLGAMDEILTENGSYYELGYYPSPAVRDGKFHNIQVTVKRPGTHVRARPGYMAASAIAAPPASLEATLDKALGDGMNVSGLTLNAFAAPIAASSKGMKTVVTVEVTYPVPADGSRRIDDDLQVSVIALDPEGKIKSSSTHPWHFSGKTPAEGAVTFLVNDVIDLPSQSLTLRVGAASKALAKTGTIQVPIDVPKLSDDKLQLSGLALGFAGEPREAALGRDAIAAIVPFQPTTTRTFRRTDVLRLFGRLFWGGDAKSAAVTIKIRGVAGTENALNVNGEVRANSHRQATLDANVPLKNLAPGDYVLEVTARLSQSDAVSRLVPFTIK